MLKYAGIGSRQTPPDILAAMESIGEQLGERWTLRSGYAHGADMAFGRGAEAQGNFEMYIPWPRYNNAPENHPRFIDSLMPEALKIAEQYHPAWKRCTNVAKMLHGRNSHIVLGFNLDDPVDCVICWTPNGSGAGGTGQALRIAQAYHIPIFDLAIEASRHAVCEFTAMLEKEKIHEEIYCPLG